MSSKAPESGKTRQSRRKLVSSKKVPSKIRPAARAIQPNSPALKILERRWLARPMPRTPATSPHDNRVGRRSRGRRQQGGQDSARRGRSGTQPETLVIERCGGDRGESSGPASDAADDLLLDGHRALQSLRRGSSSYRQAAAFKSMASRGSVTQGKRGLSTPSHLPNHPPRPLSLSSISI